MAQRRGAFNFLFRPKQKKEVKTYFKMLDGYTPIFTTFDGGLYEMELTRACIHAFANHCSKLQPNIEGADLRKLHTLLDGKPNPFMTSAQFIYKLATIYETQNTAFIVPLLDEFDRTVGFYPVNPQVTEIVEVDGEPFIRFTFRNQDKIAIELNRVGVINKFLYRNDVLGEDNRALIPTLQLMDVQNQGIAEGIKNSASFRFMAQLSNFATSKDSKKERDDFVEKQFGSGSGGMLLFPNTYSHVQQIQSHAQIVSPEEMEIIQKRVFAYFGTNEEILQNKAFGDAWAAYYESKIEPFAIQLSQAMTMMTFSSDELSRHNAIVWSSNRLQYMTNADKLNVSSQMFDRGILSINMVNDIWNMPHVEDGDKRYIRKEYTEVTELSDVEKLKQKLAIATAQIAFGGKQEPEGQPSKEPNDPTNNQQAEGGEGNGNTAE